MSDSMLAWCALFLVFALGVSIGAGLAVVLS